MASSSGAIPPEIAKSVKSLFRECLRRAQYVGNKHGNVDAVVRLVRNEFKKNMNEMDLQKIEKLKEAAVRGLFNHTAHEASQMAQHKDAYCE